MVALVKAFNCRENCAFNLGLTLAGIYQKDIATLAVAGLAPERIARRRLLRSL